MPQRPPSFAERLRSALGQSALGRHTEPTTTPARPTGAPTSKGDEFAERLRRAVAARH